MSQITWKNVASTTGSGGASLMNSAMDGLKDSFASLQGIMDQQQETQKHNTLQMRENNTAAFLDTLHQYRTPEELEAAREQGVFQDMREQFGASVDRDAVRRALDERAGTLRTRVESRQSYEDGQVNRGLRDEVQSLRVAALAGDQEAVARMAELGYRDNGEMISATFTDFTKGMGEQRAQANEGRQQRAEQRSVVDFNNRQADRAREAADRARREAAEAQVLTGVTDYRAAVEERNDRISQLAAEVGIEVDLNSGQMPGLHSADADTLAAFRETLTREGLDQPISETAFVNDAVNKLIEAGTIKSPQEATAQYQQLVGMLNVNTQLAPRDQERLNARNTEITSFYEAQQSDLEEENRKEIAQNIFLEDLDLTSDRMQVSLDELDNVDINAFLKNSNYRDLNQYVMDLSMRGVSAGGERVDIPPVVAQGIIRHVASRWTGQAKHMERAVNRFIEQNVDQIVDAARWTETYRSRQAKLQREQLQELGSASATFNRQAGTIHDSAAEIEQFLRWLEREANE